MIPAVGDLIISETATSMWSYHLRVVGPEGPKYGGRAPTALCGKALGWDTTMPIAAWGKPSHVPMRFCSSCRGKAVELGYAMPE